jgi:hypothetical protein
MRIGLFAATAVLLAGAAPLWAQSNQDAVIQAAVDNGCELSREDARRSLRNSGMTPQEVRGIIRDLVAAGRGRIEGGVFIYEGGSCAPAADERPQQAEETTTPPQPRPAEMAETAAEAAGEMPREDRTNDMVALIRANDCEMTDAEAEVIFDAARLSYFEISQYLMALVEEGEASFDGQTVVLSEDLCEAAN